MSNEDDLDDLLVQLRAAEAADEPEEVLNAIRQRIHLARCREATGLGRVRAGEERAAELASLPPGFLRGEGAPEPCVMFVKREPADPPARAVGANRIGGLPDLPPEITWPTHKR